MLKAVFGVVALVMASAALAERVDNFVLLDHTGDAHELHYYSDRDAVVLMVQGNGCPVVRNALPDLRAVREQFSDANVEFLMINSNLQDYRVSIAAEAEEWGIDLPILDDDSQLIGESLGLTRTAEVFVIDTDDWSVAYRGPINDRLSYERQKKEASKHFVADALNAVLAGEEPSITSEDAIGCLINFPGEKEREAHRTISYSDTIAPMLEDNCVACHQEGGIGPWAMSSYEMVRGFAPMIREVVRTKRMPPWHADPHVGDWQNDAGLTVEERQTLIHWIEAGAPRGEGDDPLEMFVADANIWPLGEPDLIVELPSYDIPASGVVDYQFPSVKNPLDEDVWVRAMTVVPGRTEVVHHVLVGATAAGQPPNESEGVFDNYLGGYAPGTGYTKMPEGTGVYLPADSHFMFQLHYTPFGKDVSDTTKIGLYFHDEPPANFLRHGVVLNPTIRIPAGAKRHEQAAYYQFDRDAHLHTILPHSHYRGRSSTFALRYPDGTEEQLLNVPNYDFNWQRGYDFAEPKFVPAGSKLVHATVYDNSVQNPANPDPDKLVTWGLQSWDEMLYGDFVFTWVDETADQPIHSNERAEAFQMIGFLDRDMDGVVQLEELSDRMRQRMAPVFQAADHNKDGLSAEEYIAFRMVMRMNRPQRNASSGGE